MPTLASMNLPKPQDWKEFEQITLTCLKIKWDSPNLNYNGRQGQDQAGVDVYGEDNLGRFVGVQCKNTEDLSEAKAKQEILNAESFEPSLKAFYLATTASSDGTLQKKLRLISEERIKAGKFPVGIFFWENLVQELVKNREEFKKHYPEIKLEESEQNTGPRLLSLLDLTYRGVNLHEILGLLFGEFGSFGGGNPVDECKLVFSTIKGCGSTLLEGGAAISLREACDGALNQIADPGAAEGKDRWSVVRKCVDEILDIIRSLQYQAVGQEAAAYNLGALLARWYVNPEEKPSLSAKDKETLIQYFKALNASDADLGELVQILEIYLKDESISYAAFTPHDIYVVARRLIVRQVVEM